MGIKIFSSINMYFFHMEIKLFSISMALQNNKWVNQWDIKIVIAIRRRIANGFGVCLVHCTVRAFFARADVHVELSQHPNETAVQRVAVRVWMTALLNSFYMKAAIGFVLQVDGGVLCF